MSRILAVFMTLLVSLALVAPADAAGKSKRKKARDGYDRQVNTSREPEGDRIRAEACDPSGQYAAYPAWARIAFTCGSTGHR